MSLKLQTIKVKGATLDLKILGSKLQTSQQSRITTTSPNSGVAQAKKSNFFFKSAISLLKFKRRKAKEN